MTNSNTSWPDEMLAVPEDVRRQREAEDRAKREAEEAQRRREEEWRNSPEWKLVEDLKALGLPVGYRDAEGKRIDSAELPIGGKAMIKLKDLAVLVIDRDKNSYATLDKLGISYIPDTAKIETDHQEWLLFDASRYDVTRQALGPGVTLLSKRLIPPPNDQGIRWAKRPDEAGIAPIPMALATVDPIPLDESEYDRGLARRVTVNPDTSGQPEKLHPTLLKGRVNVFQSEPGIGKSLSALAIDAQLMQAGTNVIYYDADGNGGRIGERFASMGVGRDVLDRHFFYYNALPDPEHLDYLLNTIDLCWSSLTT